MPNPAPMTTSPRPTPAPANARLSSPMCATPSRNERLVMCVNGHANEHGREQREDVGLNEDDDELQGEDADVERYGESETDADAGGRAETFGRHEHDRQDRQQRDVPASHVGR